MGLPWEKGIEPIGLSRSPGKAAPAPYQGRGCARVAGHSPGICRAFVEFPIPTNARQMHGICSGKPTHPRPWHGAGAGQPRHQAKPCFPSGKRWRGIGAGKPDFGGVGGGMGKKRGRGEPRGVIFGRIFCGDKNYRYFYAFERKRIRRQCVNI